MARGFLTGTFWGLFTGSLVAAGGSLYVGVSKSSLPDMTQVEVPAGSGFNGSRQDKAIVVAPKIEAPERPVAPTVQAPQPESLSLSDASMETAQAPSVITTPSLSEMVPSVKNDTGLATPMARETKPVVPQVQMEQPVAPNAEAIVGLSQDPAQPILPQVAVVDTKNSTQETNDISVPEEPQDMPSLPGSSIPSSAEKGKDQEPEPTPETEPELAGPLEAIVKIAPLSDGQRALDNYAMDPVEAGDNPLISIVFIDDGSYVLDVAALESLPFPVSFAIDATWDGATDAHNKYASAGYEIAAMVQVPSNAKGQDVETTLAASVAMLPRALAFVEKNQGALQPNRDATKQVATFAKETGHGLVYFEKGLNSGVTAAQKDGVPSLTIYRDLDSDNQDERTIRRFLDGAAFRAKQERQIIILARLRPETLSALLLWALQDRAKTVALAPLSQVLLQTEN